MMERYKNKYRIPSARAAFWDYSQNGLYFITICTFNRECLFGQIVKKEMVFSPIGEIVFGEWNKSFEIRLELYCESFVIMPNHLHAILRIENDIDELDATNAVDAVQTHGRASLQVQTHGRASLQQRQQNIYPPQPEQIKSGIAYRSPKSISSFVAGFKSSATKHINEYRITPKLPVWQARYHDHIIRNSAEYQRISDYIENNPANWLKDKFFKEERL